MLQIRKLLDFFFTEVVIDVEQLIVAIPVRS